MSKTAVIYARYSSDKQREASIDDQLRVCRAWCDEKGIEVVGTYADYALSGKTDQRPEFRRMIANAPESDYVVVYMFDRFSRDRYDSATYKRMLRECDVRVLSATEPVEDTPEGSLQEGMLELLSEYYVRDLARKVRRGMEGNALKAKDNGYRIFGYKTNPETRCYEIDESEAAIVRDVFSRYISGESMHSIADHMARAGVVTSTGRPVDFNWVNRMLKRRAYTGLYSWGGIEVEGGMPRIIEDETFEMAQKVVPMKRRRDETIARYRLTGKLYCGFCGQPMHGYKGTGKSGRTYYYYGCKEVGGCGRPGTRRELVEDALKNAVLEITEDEEAMREVARRVVGMYSDDDTAKAELKSVNESIRRIEREMRNLTDAAAKGFVNDEVIARNAENAERLRELHKRHGILMSEAMDITEDDIVEFLAHGFNEEDGDFIFDSFVHSVHLYDDVMVAVFNFRDKAGDLAEIRAEINEQVTKKKRPAPSTSGFGSDLHGVGGGT